MVRISNGALNATFFQFQPRYFVQSPSPQDGHGEVPICALSVKSEIKYVHSKVPIREVFPKNKMKNILGKAPV